MSDGVERWDIRKPAGRRLAMLLFALFAMLALFGSAVAYDELVRMPWLRSARRIHEEYWAARHRLTERQVRERECNHDNKDCEREARLVAESMAEVEEIERHSLETLGVPAVTLQEYEYRSLLQQIGCRF